MHYMNCRAISIFLGWINIVLSIIIAGMCIASLINLNAILSENPEYGEVLNKVVIYQAVSTAVCVIWFILSVMLLQGIRQDRPKLMAPWVYVNYVCVIINVMFAIYECKEILNNNFSIPAKLIDSTVLFVKYSIQILIFYPVYKLYQKMTDASVVEKEIHEI